MPKRIYQSVNTVIITCGLWNTFYKVYIVPGVSTACVFLTILCGKFSNCSRWSHETGLRIRGLSGEEQFVIRGKPSFT